MSTLLDGFLGALLGGLVTASALTITIVRENRQRRRDPINAGMARLRAAANRLNIRLALSQSDRALVVAAVEELMSATITMTGYAKVLGKENQDKLTTALNLLVDGVRQWKRIPRGINPQQAAYVIAHPSYVLATIAAMYLADELDAHTYEQIVASADDPDSIVRLD